MKSLISKIATVICILCPLSVYAQVTADPIVAAAVGAASYSEQQKLDKINQKQNAITTAQTFINVELDKIKKVQQKTYNYLSHVSLTVSSAKDIKKSYDYTRKIGNLCGELKNAIVANPQGLLTTAVGTKQITKIKNEMTGLYSYIATISLDKKTLLNSAERLVITGQVAYRLEKIYYDLYTLIYLVNSLSFKDLPRLIAPEIYYSTVNQKDIAERIINSW